MEKKRDSGLDLLRCFAILSVLFLHSAEAAPSAPQAIKNLFSFGWIGVDLFFVLSGYLIGSQTIGLQKSSRVAKNFQVFWAKRWFRTLPLYFVVLAVYVLLKPAVMAAEFKPDIFPFFVFLQNYFPLTDFVQSWSICIEEQFYIILPILTFALFPKATTSAYFWAGLSVLGCLLRAFLVSRLPESASAAEVDYFVRFPLYTHFDGLTAGLFLAVTAKHWQRWSKPSKMVCVAVAVMGLWGLCWGLGPQLTVQSANFYFSFLPLIFALFLIGFKGLSLSVSLGYFVNWVALLSYGAYLWNNLVIRIFARNFPDLPWLSGVILFLLVTHILSLTTYLLIEKPFLNLRAKYLRRIG
jgi:peptidoglycan/LPS O-acetylase OafA/YrhL